MTAPLLQTKLFIPPARPGLVARSRLMARLDQADWPGCHAVLLTAPAALFGVLARIRDLNLTLVSVQRVEEKEEE